ncbi:MAG: alpha/beta hydrolase [bacterium]
MAVLQTPHAGQIHYEFYPKADAPTVVFLNGMTQSTLHWKTQAKAFNTEYQVITYDARGQGASPCGETPLTLALHAQDLDALLEALEVSSVFLVGFSHGARVALQFTNDFPARVDRLALISATAKPSALAKTIFKAWQETLRLGGLEAMTWCALPTILGEKFLAENQAVIPGIVKASLQRNQLEGVTRLLDALEKYPDLSELAQGVTCPTLVLTADEDLLVTTQGARELAKLCGGRHIEIEGVGHTIPIEAPEGFRQTVRSFLIGALD